MQQMPGRDAYLDGLLAPYVLERFAKPFAVGVLRNAIDEALAVKMR